MATTKISITLEDEQVAAIRALVESAKADSVSAFVKHAVSVSLADVADWGAMLALTLKSPSSRRRISGRRRGLV